MNLKELMAELQLKPCAGDELTIAVATRLLETMRKVDELGAQLNAIQPQPRGLFDRMRLVVKGR